MPEIMTRQLMSSRVLTAGHLAVGLGVVGIAGYAFVAIAGYVFVVPVQAAELSALTAVYLMANIIGPGTFFPLEQETSRAVSARVARGESPRTDAMRAGRLGLGLLGILTVVLLVLWSTVLETVLDGRPGLFLALLVAGAGFALVYWVRGVLSGQGRFRGYALTLYLEGAVRLVPCVALFLLAVATPEPFAVAFAAGSAVAGLALLPILRLGPPPAVKVPAAAMGGSLALLVVAGLMTQLIANLGPVIVTFRLPEDPVAAAAYSVTFVLVRLPLFLFAPVQALLVPALTRAAESARPDLLRRRLGYAVLAALAIAVPGAIVATLAGPWALQVLFNATVAPPTEVFAWLGISTLLMMVALSMQGALVALGLQRTVGVAWAAGAAVFVLLLVAPGDPVIAALAAQVGGPIAVVIWSAIALRRVLRRVSGQSLCSESRRPDTIPTLPSSRPEDV